MSNGRVYSQPTTRSGPAQNQANGPIIDQDGREVRPDRPRVDGFDGFAKFGAESFTIGGNPFGNLTRAQRLARLDALAKLLDVAFVMPGTNIRYGIDGIIGLIPVVGDVITTALSLWLVKEARALGAPWHVTARMLGNVALDGVVGIVPVVGDAFDVMFRANIRNMKLLRRWLERHGHEDEVIPPGR